MSKQKTILNYISTVVFIFLLAMPILFFDKENTVSKNEKRDLAMFPNIISSGKINKKLFKEIDVYISDRFGFRQDLIQIDNNLKYKVLGDSGNDRVVLGKKNFLYYISKQDGDNLKDYFKLNLVSPSDAEKFADLIRRRQVWCEKNGIKFIFLIAPNKHNIYPEYYIVDRPEGITRTEQFTSAMKEKKVNYIYPYDELIKSKAHYSVPLYYETDTHWNQLGAYITFQLLNKFIIENFPKYSFPNINYSFDIDRNPGGGDLTPMLGLRNYGVITKITFKPNTSDWHGYYKYLKNEGRSGIQTENINQDLPRAIIFRDSFFTSIEPFTSSIFSSVDYRWKFFEEKDKEYILKEKPDIIIWEIVERYSSNLLNISFDE